MRATNVVVGKLNRIDVIDGVGTNSASALGVFYVALRLSHALWTDSVLDFGYFRIREYD